MLPKLSVAATAGGASGDVAGIWLDEPMCMHTVVPNSAQVWKNGSHAPLCSVGRPSLAGISLNATAVTPRAVLRRNSATARSMSHSGMICNGISRPSPCPAHSSTIQSL